MEIPEIGYSTDFETDDGGWESAGWVRMDNLLPQTYRLALIYLGSKPRVEYVPLAADVSADVPLHFDSSLKNIIKMKCSRLRNGRFSISCSRGEN